MAECEVCRHDYDKAFRVVMADDTTHIFDSFECAIHALAPTCPTCGVRVVGHGVTDGTDVYCCTECGGGSALSEGFTAN